MRSVSTLLLAVPTSVSEVGTSSQTIAVTPEGGFVYVTNDFDGTTSVINTRTNTVRRNTINVGELPTGIAIG